MNSRFRHSLVGAGVFLCGLVLNGGCVGSFWEGRVLSADEPAQVVATDLPQEDEEATLAPQLNQEDLESLREWIKTRREGDRRDRLRNLVISGEVRTEFQSQNEKVAGVKQRGSGGAFPEVPMRAWDIEVNLFLKYKTERTFAVVKLEFDNDAGTESGTFNKLRLERAYLGGKLVNADTYTIESWIGRWKLDLVFDSRIQFSAFMDGLLFKYDHALDCLGDLYLHGGAFLIDDKLDHYGYVGEVGLLNAFGTGLYSKFSMIDWDTKDTGDELRNLKFAYLNLQWLIGYRFAAPKLNGPINVYSAALVNTAADKHDYTAEQRANWAGYVGFSVGDLDKQWDWSFGCNYQWVGAQAIPDFDLNGIGHGNASNSQLFARKVDDSEVIVTDPIDAGGAGNYQGITLTLNYLLTDNITIYQNWSQTRRLCSAIGKDFSYKMYEIEFIYSF